MSAPPILLMVDDESELLIVDDESKDSKRMLESGCGIFGKEADHVAFFIAAYGFLPSHVATMWEHIEAKLKDKSKEEHENKQVPKFMASLELTHLFMMLYMSQHNVSTAWIKAHFKSTFLIKQIEMVIAVFAKYLRTLGFDIPSFHLDGLKA